MNINIIIILVLVAIFGIYFFYSFRKIKNMPVDKDHEKIKVLTDQNFKNQIKSGITLVDFWAEWCMPCKMMAPVLNNVANELSENTKVGKLNIEHHHAVASKYKVKSIPTLIMFKNGQEIKRFVGVKTKDFYLNEIKKIS